MKMWQTFLLAGLLLSGCAPFVLAAPPAASARCPEVELPADFDPTSLASVQRAIGKGPPLLYALGAARRDTLKQMLAAGENPNVCILGASLLAISAASGDADEVALLLAKGAKPDEPRDHNGGTPLLSALSLGKFATAKVLLIRGADPLTTSDGGTTALHDLATAFIRTEDDKQQQLDLAADLIRRGVPVNAAVRIPGTTALMMASLQGHTDLARLLLAAGADPAVRNAKGMTALAFAQRRGHEEVVRLLTTSAALPRQ